MRLEVSIEERGRRALENLLKVLTPGEIFASIKKLFDRLALVVAGHIIKKYLSGQVLRRRTGALARSIVGRGVYVDGIPAIRCGIFRGPSLRYAGPQEYGTKDISPGSPYPVIKPVKAKALAFPPEGSPVLTPAGVPRIRSPREYKQRFGAELRFVPFRNSRIAIGALYDERDLAKVGRKVIRDKSGRFLNGEDRRILSLKDIRKVYILARQTSLHPRLYLFNGMIDNLPMIALQVVTHLEGLLNGTRKL